MKTSFRTTMLAAGAAALLCMATAVSAAPPKKAVDAPAPAPHPGAAAADQGAPITGKVVETMNGGGYTYVCLEKNGKQTWVAVPEMKVETGTIMSFAPGQEMPGFSSKTLNRTFDRIIFSGGPISVSAAPRGGAVSGAAGAGKAGTVPDKAEKVEKAAGPGAYTIAEIFAKRKELNKKTVAVRGKVVKVTTGVMNKNWIHLQDGSGEHMKGNHNLVVTTQQVPTMGDVVTVRGKLHKDKDFGAGYNYMVIIEDATVQP